MADAYGRIRDFVSEALRQRDRTDTPEYSRPSAYWKDFCRYSHYVQNLSPEELHFLRYHTWHLTGDNYQRYYFALDGSKRGLIEEYELLCGRLKADKPFAEGDDGIGFDTERGKISDDLVRYLLVLVDLAEHDCLSAKGPQTVLEIGGGYGGLATQCMTFNPSLAYVLVDLEETLFFQAVHLQNRFGSDRIALYDFASDRAPEPEPGRFHLIPQSKLVSIRNMRFDVAINQQSMQEMSDRQVEIYCDVLQTTTRRFYSCNLQHHQGRIRTTKGTVENLNAYLSSRFTVLWDSQADRTWGSKAMDHLPPVVTLAIVQTRNYLGQHSPVAAKIYRKMVGTPINRSPEAALQRLILASKPG
jgi:hypothetical protein